MEGYLAGDASTALKAVGAARPGDQYRQPSANLRRKRDGEYEYLNYQYVVDDYTVYTFTDFTSDFLLFFSFSF